MATFSTDTGTVGDGITSDNILVLTGTAAANSTVTVFSGTNQLGSTTANGSGAWSFTTSTLLNATHSFTARAMDAAGNTSSASAVLSVTVNGATAVIGNDMAFPDASTTGVPAGTSLTPYSGNFTSSFSGQIIEGLDVDGAIIINHPGVTVRNVRVEVIHISASGTNSTIEDSEIIGSSTWNSGISNVDGHNMTVRRCDISGVERGIWLEADGSLIEDNYFHDLINNTGTSDPHIDGIQIPGHGALINDVIIRHNNLDLDREVSASITMRDATNVDIINNRLNGGTYIIYFEGTTTGSDVTGNRFGEYVFGYVNGTAAGAQTYSGNVDDKTGVSILGGTVAADLIDYEGAGLAVYLAMNSVPPGDAAIANLVSFEKAQYDYGLSIGVLDPVIYMWEALGLALCEGAITFGGVFGPLVLQNDAAFVTKAYEDAFGFLPGQEQIIGLTNQVQYFESIYLASGAYGTDATRIELLARGAVYGQMLGISAELDLLAWS
jgi:hypothetical protein